jgi:hypothetical protein
MGDWDWMGLNVLITPPDVTEAPHLHTHTHPSRPETLRERLRFRTGIHPHTLTPIHPHTPIPQWSVIATYPGPIRAVS